MAGRPKSTVLVNLSKIEDSLEAFIELMDSDKNVQWKENKVKIKNFSVSTKRFITTENTPQDNFKGLKKIETSNEISASEYFPEIFQRLI